LIVPANTCAPGVDLGISRDDFAVRADFFTGGDEQNHVWRDLGKRYNVRLSGKVEVGCRSRHHLQQIMCSAAGAATCTSF